MKKVTYYCNNCERKISDDVYELKVTFGYAHMHNEEHTVDLCYECIRKLLPDKYAFGSEGLVRRMLEDLIKKEGVKK